MITFFYCLSAGIMFLLLCNIIASLLSLRDIGNTFAKMHKSMDELALIDYVDNNISNAVSAYTSGVLPFKKGTKEFNYVKKLIDMFNREPFEYEKYIALRRKGLTSVQKEFYLNLMIET